MSTSSLCIAQEISQGDLGYKYFNMAEITARVKDVSLRCFLSFWKGGCDTGYTIAGRGD